jgi:hypothetical protein
MIVERGIRVLGALAVLMGVWLSPLVQGLVSNAQFWITAAAFGLGLAMVVSADTIARLLPMRFSWQNLNEIADGVDGSGWREGRCWWWVPDFDFGTWRWAQGRCFEFSWAHWRPGKTITDFAFGWHLWPRTKWAEPRWQVHVGFLGGSWWFGVPDHDSWSRRSGLYLFGDHFNVFWRWDDSVHPPERGWQRSWFLLDLVLGRAKYRSIVTQVEVDVPIPMPERAYRASVTLHLDTWERPRWPWAKRIPRATIDMEEGDQIPFPGKGENSWDCGEDATYGITLPAKTVSEAVAGLVGSVLRRRERHGGSVMWQPASVRE